MDDVTLKIWSYISSYCLKVVQSLQNEVKTPTKIAEDTGIRTNHPSKVLKDLKSVGVAECVNEEARKGRLYRLTDKGEIVCKNISIK